MRSKTDLIFELLVWTQFLSDFSLPEYQTKPQEKRTTRDVNGLNHPGINWFKPPGVNWRKQGGIYRYIPGVYATPSKNGY